MKLVSDKTSEYIQMLGGLDRLPNVDETVFPWLMNWKYTSFQLLTFCMVVDLDKLGLSFYLWHPLQHFLWSRDRARLGSLIRSGHCCNRPS